MQWMAAIFSPPIGVVCCDVVVPLPHAAAKRVAVASAIMVPVWIGFFIDMFSLSPNV
jgi:hypothetical protein